MNKMALTLSTLAVAGLASGALGLAATANAEPQGPASAQDTISTLQGEGYHVIVHNVGDRPLGQATVTSIVPVGTSDYAADYHDVSAPPQTGAHTFIVNVA